MRVCLWTRQSWQNVMIFKEIYNFPDLSKEVEYNYFHKVGGLNDSMKFTTMSKNQNIKSNQISHTILFMFNTCTKVLMSLFPPWWERKSGVRIWTPKRKISSSKLYYTIHLALYWIDMFSMYCTWQLTTDFSHFTLSYLFSYFALGRKGADFYHSPITWKNFQINLSWNSA